MNFVKNILSSEKKFNLTGDHFILSNIKKLETESEPTRIFSILELIFSHIKKTLGEDLLKQRISSYQDQSHCKEIYFSLKTTHGLLRFEKIQFNLNKKTNLHVHPEYILDEVLCGSLEESLYQKTKSGCFKVSKIIRKNAGHVSKIYDPHGHPHKVESKKRQTMTACLYLGHEDVKEVQEIMTL